MRLGVDFGGTKIEAALLDLKGEIRARQRVPNPGDYRAAVRAVAELTARIEQEAGARADTVGVAMPGSLSPLTGLVRNCELGLAEREAVFRRPEGCARAACACGERRELLCFVGSRRRRCGRCSRGVRRDPRHRLRRRRRGGPQSDRGRERHRRRVGTHAVAVGARRRSAAARLVRARWVVWSNGFPAPASSAGRA